MDKNRRDNHEAHYRPHEIYELIMISILGWHLRQRYRLAMLQFSSCQDRNEDRAHADWAEMTSEQCFTPCFDVRYKRFEGQHDRNPAEEQDKNGDDHKTPSHHAKSTIVELRPRDDGSKVNEISQVKQK